MNPIRKTVVTLALLVSAGAAVSAFELGKPCTV